MAGLTRFDPDTPDGKFPQVFRRDGTRLDPASYFVLLLTDPAAQAALTAYADESERLGRDPKFVADVRQLVTLATTMQASGPRSDPDAPRPDPAS